jgi:RNA polymerase sigma-70 factor (ECF subfamily)
VAFVLHDVFALPFEEIAGLIDRTPETARQLASRARRKVRAPADVDGATLARHRQLAEAFLHAARTSDMAALLRLLDPDVVATADEHAARGGAGKILSGADRVAGFIAGKATAAHVALVNGDVGIVVAPGDRLLIAVIPRFANGRITRLHAIAAPEDLAKLEIGVVGEEGVKAH